MLRDKARLFIEFKGSDKKVDMIAVRQAMLILVCLWWHRKDPTYMLLSSFEDRWVACSRILSNSYF